MTKLPPPKKGPTRAEEQARINDLCLKGEISMEQWRLLTDELSDLSKWSGVGRLK